MSSRWTRRAWLTGASAVLGVAPAAAQPPKSYPRSYQHLVNLAEREGTMLVYSAADSNEMDEPLRAFRETYPRVKIQYTHLASQAVYDRFLAETSAGTRSADMLFSSAMDLQIKLVNDGYALPYASPEKPSLPAWAIWKNQAYGVTAEPIVFAYNRRLMPSADVPTTHTALESLLRTGAAAYKGKIATYDVELSGTGFLLFSQDLQITRDTLKLVRAIGRTQPGLFVSGDEMLAKVSSGQHLFAHNVISSYALERSARDPNIGVQIPEDYALMMSRIAFISKDARSPSSAKLFLDFLLSLRGQTLLAKHFLRPVRIDMPAESVATATNNFRAIHVGPALLANLDRVRHARLIADWKRNLAAS